MDLKKGTTNELRKNNKNHSLAWEIMTDLKRDNLTLKVLLGLSILANILIVIMLR